MFSKVSGAGFALDYYKAYSKPVPGAENPISATKGMAQALGQISSSQAGDAESSGNSLSATSHLSVSGQQQSLFRSVSPLSATTGVQPQASGVSDPGLSPAGTDSGGVDKASQTSKLEQRKQLQDQALISQLAATDREVRNHEQAHMAVGGAYAGAAKYQFQRGPDGVNYAVGGEVPIDVSKEPNPEQTIRKAQTVRRAALAPAEPSPQDRQVAAEASRMEMQARQELALELRQSQSRRADSSEVAGSETGIAEPGNTSSASSSQEEPSLVEDAVAARREGSPWRPGGFSINSRRDIGDGSTAASRLQTGIDNSGFQGPRAGTRLSDFA